MTMEMQQAAAELKRCVIVVDRELPAGRAANAAAVIALTLGKRHPDLAGPDLVDASGWAHPGLIPIGIAVLGASEGELRSLRAKAVKSGVDVVDFPGQGQQTTDYDEFRTHVGQVVTEELSYVAVGLYGSRKAVGKIVGGFGLFK
jgi:Protein of unknown function (DUF2000)